MKPATAIELTPASSSCRSRGPLHRLLASVGIAVSCVALPAVAAEGLVEVKSPYAVAETIDRLDAGARQRGLKVFARIDHAAGAASVGKNLRPTELIIFGSPPSGTPFMECAQTVGIDLPLKALAWQDEQGQVWLAYNDPGYVGKRHGVAGCPAVAPISKALSSLVSEAVAR